MRLICLYLLVLFGVWNNQSQAKSTGREAALKYFTQGSREPASESFQGVVQTQSTVTQSSQSSGRNLLAVAVGSLIQGQSHNWIEQQPAGWMVSAQYSHVGQGLFAKTYELDLQKFNDQDRELSKLAVLVHVVFPKRLSFPVYIGGGVGPGYFFRQARGFSELTLDYKAYVGVRFSHDYGQYFLQSGVKNHLHVLDSGQFIGWYFSSGVAYTF